LAADANIYRIAVAEPPAVSKYPPVYTLLEANLSAIFGPDYWHGHRLLVLCTAAAALFAGSIVVC
jgi:hypothetical protein